PAPPPPETYTLSLHDALPISAAGKGAVGPSEPDLIWSVGRSATDADSKSVFIERCIFMAPAWVAWERHSKLGSPASPVLARPTAFSKSSRCSRATARRSAA